MSLRRRTSIREIFRSKSRLNLVEANQTSPDAPAPRAAYVPVNAAFGFSQTFKSPRSFQFQTSLPTTREETTAADSSSRRGNTDTDIDGTGAEYALRRERISHQLIRPGHLYIDLPPEDVEPEPEPGSARAADDFRAFIAAANAQEEARLYFTNPPGTTSPHYLPESPSQPQSPAHLKPIRRQRDSGYSSASLSPLRDANTLSGPWQAPAQQRDGDGQGPGLGRERTLRKRQSLRLVGQRIAEYVRPMDGGPLSASHAAVR